MIIAYNHEQFIQQAIEGVLMQQDAPDFEIVIGEDRSTDNTRAIIEEMATKYPEKIRVRFGVENVGTTRNYIRTLRDCEGEYVAILDGDDYWTDPEKLRKQATFLDQNPACTICFHNAMVLYMDEDREARDYVSSKQKTYSSLLDLLSSNFIPTCSTMFRNQLFTYIPDWYFRLKMSDYPLHIMNAQHGLIGYIDEVMAVYRVHLGGIWGMKAFEKQLKADIEFFGIMENYLGPEYKEIIDSAIERRFEGLALCFKEKALSTDTIQDGIEEVFSSLNELEMMVRPTDAWISRLLSSIYMDYAFLGYKRGEPHTTRYCLIRAIRLDPKWIRNRGVRSIWIRSFVSAMAK